MKKKILAILICFTLTVISAVGGTVIANAFEKFTYVVVLDAGHGGVDNGVSGVESNVTESELNLKMTYQLKNIFEKSGFKVILTRTDENGLYGEYSDGFKLRDLKKRVEIVNSSKADLFISVHMNKYSQPSRRGAQVFYKINDETSNYLAEKIQLRINLMKESSRICQALKGDYYVLNNSEIPSVLVECGFLSNKKDEELLLSEQYREKLAIEIFKGAVDYLNAKCDRI